MPTQSSHWYRNTGLPDLIGRFAEVQRVEEMLSECARTRCRAAAPRGKTKNFSSPHGHFVGPGGDLKFPLTLLLELIHTRFFPPTTPFI